ncbi:hypothetical protein WL32_06815 [Burkholderia cepacia]|nr:hypothetical protein WL32_06815 [Burkholderia cepacia]
MGSLYVETAVAYRGLVGNFLRSVPSERRIGEFFLDAQKAFGLYIEIESSTQLQTSGLIFNARILSVTPNVRGSSFYVETAVDVVGATSRGLLI